MNILTSVFPQSDGQAESQYAAARKATQDRFGFYQVCINVLFHVCRWILIIKTIANSPSQGSNPKWSNALSATGGAS